MLLGYIRPQSPQRTKQTVIIQIYLTLNLQPTTDNNCLNYTYQQEATYQPHHLDLLHSSTVEQNNVAWRYNPAHQSCKIKSYRSSYAVHSGQNIFLVTADGIFTFLPRKLCSARYWHTAAAIWFSSPRCTHAWRHKSIQMQDGGGHL